MAASDVRSGDLTEDALAGALADLGTMRGTPILRVGPRARLRADRIVRSTPSLFEAVEIVVDPMMGVDAWQLQPGYVRL